MCPLCVIFTILVSFSQDSALFASKAKVNVFWKKILTPLAPSDPIRLKKFQKTLILAFEANSTLSRENETKIVKITHSVSVKSGDEEAIKSFPREVKKKYTFTQMSWEFWDLGLDSDSCNKNLESRSHSGLYFNLVMGRVNSGRVPKIRVECK